MRSWTTRGMVAGGIRDGMDTGVGSKVRHGVAFAV